MPLAHLGQSGFRLRLGSATIYIDPYLSDYVERVAGPGMRRLRPAPLRPDAVRDADIVLISHAHIDHCDPDTLRPIATHCPSCQFVASFEATSVLTDSLDIDPDRVKIGAYEPIEMMSGIVVHPVPAAHRDLETDAMGRPRYLGFVVEHEGRRIYHAGDGSVHCEVIAAVKRLGPIDTALIPVNECNYFRHKAGIVGNMSIRDAFGFAEEIGASRVIPMHYDMFAPNLVYEEEISVVYRNLRPRFSLELPRCDISWPDR